MKKNSLNIALSKDISQMLKDTAKEKKITSEELIHLALTNYILSLNSKVIDNKLVSVFVSFTDEVNTV